MAGKPTHAEKLSNHLGTEIDAACMINKPGATATVAVGGVLGLAATAAATKKAANGEIKVVTNGWLAIAPTWFALVNGDKFLGNPKGEPYAQVRFDDVDSVSLKPGRLTIRADVALVDGRSFAFEAKTKGANKGNPEVLELFAARCG